jgi:hypothetical protein
MRRNFATRLTFTAALMCATLTAIGATDASAQSGGVFVDPDSPSGKEYAIPLESARRQADPQAPSGHAGGPAAAPATLFGEGVVSPSSTGGKSSSDEGGKRAGKRGSTVAEPDTDSATRDIVKIAASRPGAPDGGIGTPALVLGLGILVLLVGALAGVLIRRRSDP